MKPVLLLIIIALVSWQLSAQESWPELDKENSEKAWANITVEELSALLEEHEVEARGGKYDSTTLMFAMWNNNPVILETLLDAGADVSGRNDNGSTPLIFAAQNNTNPEIVRILLRAGADATAQNDFGRSVWNVIQQNEDLQGTDV